MIGKKERPRLMALVVIGIALVAVGISTGNGGILGAGIVFIIIGAAAGVRARRAESSRDDAGVER